MPRCVYLYIWLKRIVINYYFMESDLNGRPSLPFKPPTPPVHLRALVGSVKKAQGDDMSIVEYDKSARWHAINVVRHTATFTNIAHACG